MRNRIIAILLALCAAMPAFTACAEENPETPANEAAAETGENAPAETEEETEYFLDHIGAHDFKGENFTVLCRTILDTDTFNEVDIETNAGDVVDDAIYRRNQELNERYNVVIKAERTDGNWSNNANFKTVLKNSITAGDGAYDLVLGYQAYLNSIEMMGYFYNFRELDGLNLDADYYYQDIIKESTLNDKLYHLTGDFTYSLWPSMLVYFFNKDMAAAYDLGNLYDFVRSGEWTVDKYLELVGGVYVDVNGNGKKDEGDEFGVALDYGNIADAYYSSFDIDICVRNEENIPEINVNIEKLDAVISKMQELYHNYEGAYVYKMMSNMTTNPLADIFTAGRALFYPERLKNAIDFRGIDVEFGILPYPKWDAAQEKYLSQAWDGYSVMVIPKDARNFGKTAVMVEALNASSQEYVIPAFYDKTLKVKVTRDEDSAEMLDTIREGISFQFGYFFSGPINAGCDPWRMRLILESNGKIASTFKGLQKVLGKNVQSIVDFYFAEDPAAE